MSQDLALDPETGDLLFVGGDLQFLEGAEAVAQHIRVRLRFFLGEWFLDLREGVPYFREVLGIKNPSITVLTSIFRGVVEKTPGVASVSEFRLTFDTERREASIDFTATAADGGVITTRDSAPFIVEV